MSNRTVKNVCFLCNKLFTDREQAFLLERCLLTKDSTSNKEVKQGKLRVLRGSERARCICFSCVKGRGIIV